MEKHVACNYFELMDSKLIQFLTVCSYSSTRERQSEVTPSLFMHAKKKYSAILKRYLLTLMLDLQLSRKHNHAQLSVLSSYGKFDQAEQPIGIYGKMLVQCQPSLQSHHLIEKKLASATRSCHCLCGRQLLMPLPTIHATRPSIDITHTTISRRFNIPLTLHFIFEAQIFLIHKVKVPSCITRTPAHCKIYYIQILIKKKKKYAYPRFAARARRRLTMWLCRDIGLGYGYYLTQCLFFFSTFFFSGLTQKFRFSFLLQRLNVERRRRWQRHQQQHFNTSLRS